VPYLAVSGRNTYKKVLGRSERNQVYWHLAMKVNVVLGPPAVVRFKPYLCFSEGGRIAINDAKKTSCDSPALLQELVESRSGGNFKRPFAVFLADGHDTIEISLGWS